MNILVCISSVPDTTSPINFTDNNLNFDNYLNYMKKINYIPQEICEIHHFHGFLFQIDITLSSIVPLTIASSILST